MQYKPSDLTFTLAVYILVGVTVCHTFLGEVSVWQELWNIRACWGSCSNILIRQGDVQALGESPYNPRGSQSAWNGYIVKFMKLTQTNRLRYVTRSVPCNYLPSHDTSLCNRIIIEWPHSIKPQWWPAECSLRSPRRLASLPTVLFI